MTAAGRRVRMGGAALLAAALGCAGAAPPLGNETLPAAAAAARPGAFPKYATGVASYWTAVGAPGDDATVLVNEEGMVEIAAGRFSVEPRVEVDGRVVGWADVRREQTLVEGDLPLPVVTWRHDAFTLTLSVLADGAPGAGVAWLRYRLVPAGPDARALRLRLAVRPLQVLPPWQTLNVVGGVGRIDRVQLAGGVLRVDERRLATSPPAASLEAPARGAARPWSLVWPAGTTAVDVVASLHDGGAVPDPREAGPVEARVRAAWRERTDRIGIRLPADGADAARALRATLGWILTLRDGPAIRPGPRNYARSWIRDGALTSTALLMLGHAAEVRAYLRWYASFQLSDGRIPCCVDARGADPTPEYDSDGEFLHVLAEYWRFTGDGATVRALWPVARRAADHVLALRSRRLGPAFVGTAIAGLVPESISHEGYAKHAVHSYWDDTFALQGLGDAAALATVVGDAAAVRRFAAVRDAFARDLGASMRLVMAERGIDWVPASVELADFDPTSTALAVTLGESASILPPEAVARTFDRYVGEIARWQAGAPDRDAYTPYEARNAEALVRLGRRDDAWRVLRFVLDGRRPTPWQVWPEVITADPAEARFLGDMPHGWGGATVVRAVRTMLAYERARDDALVIAAGVPRTWLDDPDGVAVRDLPTHWGPLGYTLGRVDGRVVRLEVAGGVRVPPGGIVVAAPLRSPVAARVDGRPVRVRPDGRVVLRRVPARVELEEGR